MSISSAMSNAVLGLRAAGRGAEVISSNISNALTPGYGRRELVLTSGSLGGVREAGVSRLVDAGLSSDRRLSEAAHTNAKAQLNFLQRVEGLLGTPDAPGSLSVRLADFEGSLITAISRPDAPDRLNTAVARAGDLAKGLRAASDGIQQARSEADQTIAGQVRSLNNSLAQVEKLNAGIRNVSARGGDTNALKDQRQKVVDTIGTLVPLRIFRRDGDAIALYATSGASLVDGRASEITFAPVNVVTADMSLDAGTLSGLSINGKAVRTDGDDGALRGGALAAQFTIRDKLGISAQSQVDAFARDLVERFSDPAVDPSLSLGDVGLFTDNGVAINPVNEQGLSSRIALNSAVDSEQGGESWRIRDGINATTQGPVGDSKILQNLADALNTNRPIATGSFAGSSFTSTGMVSAMISDLGSNLIGAERQVSFTSSRLSTLTQEQLADGVDSDQEIQRLILVEQSYAANARMLEVLDEMMQIMNRL